MKNLFPTALLAVLWTLAVPPTAHAQPSSGGPGPGPGPAPTDTPLDGGASLLLAGGVAYALRRLRRVPPPR